MSARDIERAARDALGRVRLHAMSKADLVRHHALIALADSHERLRSSLAVATQRAASLEVAKCRAEREVAELRAIVGQYVPTEGVD
jgi:hypothetical protein